MITFHRNIHSEAFGLHPIADQMYENELSIDFLLYLSDEKLDEIARELSKSIIQQQKLKYAVHKTKEQRSRRRRQQAEVEYVDEPEEPEEEEEEEKNVEITLLIEIKGNETISVTVHAEDTVHTLKSKIEAKQSGYPVRFQSILTRKGQILEDQRTLSFYKINAEDTLYLKRFQPATRIIIKSITGQSREMEIKEECQVQDIKKQIAKERDIPFEEITLIYAGKRLQNEKTLTEYKIAHDSTLHFCRRK